MAAEFGIEVPEHTIVGHLGQGGMARVFLARDEALGRLVAVKVIDASFDDDPELLQRFEREARLAGSLAHPHIVPVHRFGRTADGRLYLTMAYLEGGSLSERLRGGATLPIAEALAVTRQIASALEAAHKRQIVHRDLKPGNVLFHGDAAFLADFGIAKLLGASTELTHTGMSPGTVRYFSPEQAQGQPVDARCDIYALGTMLYEMLAGRTPIRGDSAASVIVRIAYGVPDPLPAAWRGLQRLMDVLLAKDPADRPDSCAEVLVAIDAVTHNWLRYHDADRLTEGVTLRAPRASTPRPDPDDVTIALSVPPRVPDDQTMALGAETRSTDHTPVSTAAVTLPVDRVAAGDERALQRSEVPTNLPRQATSFIGRERELALVRGLLREASLVTLTGPGGIGKTRLSLQIAASVLEEFPDGVWLVELASISDEALVPRAVAQVLGLQEEAGAGVVKALCAHLAPRRVLVVLDNCEHLVAACAALADSLLRAAPRVHVLASSREILNVAGEQSYALPPLGLPDPTSGAAAAAASDAGRLFIARARLRQPEFVLNDANLAAIARICARLDGIPLALELAAARIGVLDVATIAVRLNDRFGLLTGGSRTSLPRQQTLRALIDWSYDLLGAAEKVLFSRLAVFAGGCTLAAVEQVCADRELPSESVLDALASLVQKSLVVADGAGARYHLLETMREYARERLHERGESSGVRSRHRDYFVALAETAEPYLEGGSEQPAWLSRLDQEHDNLRAVLAGHDPTAQDDDTGLLLCGALYRFWAHRGHAVEGRQWCEAVLARAASPGGVARLKALHASGTLAWRLGDIAAARSQLQVALALSRSLGDRLREGRILNNLGGVAIHQGDEAAAREFLEQAATIHHTLGNAPLEARALSNLSALSINDGRYAEAHATLQRAFAIIRELDNPMEEATALSHLGFLAQVRAEWRQAQELHERALATARKFGVREFEAVQVLHLGEIALARGDLALARSNFRNALEISVEIGNQHEVALCLEAIAMLLLPAGMHAEAAYFCGAADAIRSATVTPRTYGERAQHQVAIDACRESLGETAAQDNIAEGRAAPAERVLVRARSRVAEPTA